MPQSPSAPASTGSVDAGDTLLDVADLRVRFHTRHGTVNAVNGVSFTVRAGEVVGFVGESGCGKSVTARSVLRLNPESRLCSVSGTVRLAGRDIFALDERDMRDIRGDEVSMIFQDPMASLNPVLTVGQQIDDVLQRHQGLRRRQARNRTVELLDLVGIHDAAKRADDYPHHFSGGMRQRVMIAMAISCEPRLLIADEPTTALDVTIQAQILRLLERLRRELDMALMIITHDLGVVAGLAHRVYVMYAGHIVEEAAVDDIFERAAHPYTRGLLDAVPRVTQSKGLPLVPIEGSPPNMIELASGCPFTPRCPLAIDTCRTAMPPLEETDVNGHRHACWVTGPGAGQEGRSST